MPDPYPKLRPIEIKPFVHDRQPTLLLRDPLSLSGKMMTLPAVLGPVLAACDGTRDAHGIQAAVMRHFGLRVSLNVIGQVLEALDELYLLDNDRAAAAQAQALIAYRNAAFRPPALADGSYPSDPGLLRHMLAGYQAEARARRDGNMPQTSAELRGLISPHIDYPRGGPVYAAVWDAAAGAVRDAELAIIFGTDHYGGLGRLTLTRQHYATPFGLLPTDQEAVNAAVEALGEEAAFEEELHHRSEHSIELAAVWLHYVRDGRPCRIVPVLCGSFSHFVAGMADPDCDPRIASLVAALQGVTSGRRTVVIAAADLAHIGPAFGGEPVDGAGKDALHAADAGLLDCINRGDATGFFTALRQVEDRNNVCGLPPIYLALRYLAPTSGRAVAYDQCPADEEGTSWVSVAGVVWE
ncbi:MAG: AmmeMemoRadiSam system protein B [Anaerolineae bacterium]|nr:AmmeMemoRadiSam system protein B [Anaerolineae bacterium]